MYASIINCIPSGAIVLEKEVTRSPYENKTSFNISCIDSRTTDILQKNESISITSQIMDFVFKRVLGGFKPIRQVTSLTTGRAVQSGTIRRLGFMPEPPAPYWSLAHIKSRDIVYKTAEYFTELGNFVYELNYTYSFEFDSEPFI